MKKKMIMKRASAISLAAIMAFTVYMPTAAFAAEGSDEPSAETTQEESSSPEPKKESAPKETPAPAPKETSAPKESSAPAPKETSAPKESSAPAPKETAAPQESSAPQETAAPEDKQDDAAAQDAPASVDGSREPEAAQESSAPADVSKDAQESKAVKESATKAKGTSATQAPAAESQDTQEPEAAEQSSEDEAVSYGEPTGVWGYGNSSRTTRWDEYTMNGETILVFRITGDSDVDEENAVTELLDSNGKSLKNELKGRVTQIVFENGITGIGWTALYDKSNYEPLYTPDYTVDRSKTDLFNGFSRLTTVTPCETIKRIGWSAFRKCNNLSSFDFSKCTQLEEIMNQAFSDCKALNNVNLSNCNTLKTVAWSAFNGAGQGKEASVSLPTAGALSIIGGYAFYGYAKNNAAGTNVDFSPLANSVLQILTKAFEGSHILGTISGFKELETVGKDAFKNSYITYIPYDPSQDEENNEAQNEGSDGNNDGQSSDNNDGQNDGNNNDQSDDNDGNLSNDNNDQNEDSNDNQNDNNNDGNLSDNNNDNNDQNEGNDGSLSNDNQNDNNNDGQSDEDDAIINEESNDDNADGSDDEIDDSQEVIAESMDIMSGEPAVVSPMSTEDASIETDSYTAHNTVSDSSSAMTPDSSSEIVEAAGTTGSSAKAAKIAEAIEASPLLTAMADNAIPEAAASADAATISNADVPMADAPAPFSHSVALSGLAAALILGLTAVMIYAGRRIKEEK